MLHGWRAEPPRRRGRRASPTRSSADGALGDLVDLVAAKVDRSARLLYLAGEDRAGDLAGDLAKRGIAVETAVIYRAVAAEKLPPHLTQALRESTLDAALHYSRRSAATLLALAGHSGAANAVTKPCPLLSVRRGGGSAARGGAQARIAVAARPDEASLLALIPK